MRIESGRLTRVERDLSQATSLMPTIWSATERNARWVETVPTSGQSGARPKPGAGSGWLPQRNCREAPLHVPLEESLELVGDVVATESAVQRAVDEDRRHGLFECARQADPDVGVL